MPSTNYLIGRQPILNWNEEIVAYELLFRSASSMDSAIVKDASYASASVIINTLSQDEMLSAQVKAFSWRGGMY